MRKSVGIVRNLDALNRVILPKSLRDTLGILPHSSVEAFIDGDRIVLRKYAPGCVFCGQIDGTSLFRHKPVCGTCRRELAQLSRERAPASR
ncbi:AbrB/MazE/SpoVT family DNA-binding domain-containing protein [Alicyclobacillus acidocaldarius]|uniref:Transcriptional regulator, AbrB family n=1 Tax=Alicyclobacillus acidocaldarius subsp. acidocaldarius (strain ATCC 27009 / DSM 446 / BCRC 14685 / JCM 5260 / KCTC 1825 / NBRC 15652 / NCIMB 11725 / NRRL B-14509 / 104-IA) TaxID=521098 RepID=C8WYE1_ALIAD|nr:AbrB/MazE/SpoVT family DNA-binding domain-containing protein [Alicyclobacillus acidocaldarius]ACV60035.1 transcriptional regulator, AbrB family [Alicyclobacillus acidocaldarius subsp. acidocaldarius DSM 446]